MIVARPHVLQVQTVCQRRLLTPWYACVQVQVVKQQLEQWEVGECGDAHVAAAVLKLWYRELYEPLIPNQLYDAAIEAHENPAQALALLHHLPQTNRLVLAYLIR